MAIDLRPILDEIRPDQTMTDIVSNTGVAYSPFTGGAQYTELPGARWKLSWSYNALQADQGRIMKTVKALFRGGAEVAHVRDFSYLARRTVEPGSPVVAAGGVRAVTRTAAGTGYTSAPAVSFSGGGGTGATATATIANGGVNAITVTAPGSGYTSAPTVAFTGGAGTGAAATASVGQSGSVLVVTGVAANAPVYSFGDQVSYLSTDGMYRMHMVTANVSADGTGKAIIPILPPMRNPPVFNSAVDSLTPSLSVNWNDGGAVTIDGVVHAVSFSLVEALYGIQ